MGPMLVCFFLAMFIGHAYSETYKEAFQAAAIDYSLPNDEPLKAFLKEGKFTSDEETKKLKCFFSTLTSKLEISDAEGNLNGEKIKQLAKANPTEEELAVFASDVAQLSCIPLPASYNSPTPCDKVYNFVSCAIAAQTKPSKIEN